MSTVTLTADQKVALAQEIVNNTHFLRILSLTKMTELPKSVNTVGSFAANIGDEQYIFTSGSYGKGNLVIIYGLGIFKAELDKERQAAAAVARQLAYEATWSVVEVNTCIDRLRARVSTLSDDEAAMLDRMLAKGMPRNAFRVGDRVMSSVEFAGAAAAYSNRPITVKQIGFDASKGHFYYFFKEVGAYRLEGQLAAY